MNTFLLSSETVEARKLGPISLRCPACHQGGTFQAWGEGKLDAYDVPQRRGFASRVCPNPECHAHVFVVVSTDAQHVVKQVVESYPLEAVEFDSTAIPQDIINTFQEALICHQVGADTAAAMMIRRTLEELCEDQGATGADLKTRIEALTQKITVPQELLEAADELRLLGNDAAHVERRVFDEIGREELEVAIEFTKDLLRSTFQLAALLDRLRALKRTGEDEATDHLASEEDSERLT